MEPKGPPTLKSIEKQLEDVLAGLQAMREGARAAGIDLDTPATKAEAPGAPAAGPPEKTPALTPVGKVEGVPVLTFPVTGPGGPSWGLDAWMVADWLKLFPGVDVLAECRKALAWVQTNQRKTARGMPRFLVGWITRAVNRGDAARIGRARGEAPASVPFDPAAAKAQDAKAAALRDRAIAVIRELSPANKRTLQGEAEEAFRDFPNMPPDQRKARIKEAMIAIVQRRIQAGG